MFRKVHFLNSYYGIFEYKENINMNIDGIKIVTQKRNNTCGYASGAMLLNFFQKSNIDEDFLLENDPIDEKGITFFKLLDIYKKYLKGYNASLVREDKEGTLRIIRESLQDNIPLQVLHLTENLLGNNESVLHYAVLTGFDEEKGTFTIADPYGLEKTLGLDEFFEAVSFRNECLPDFIKKSMPSNAMIRFTKCV